MTSTTATTTFAALTSSQRTTSVVASDATLEVRIPASWEGCLHIDARDSHRNDILDAYITVEKATELRDMLTTALALVTA